MRKLFEKRFAAETIGNLKARKAEIERLEEGAPVNYTTETEFERAYAKMTEHHCGGGRRVIRKGPPKD